MTDVLDPLALFSRPAELGQHAAAARRRAFGDHVWIRDTTAQSIPAAATVQGLDGTVRALEAWPAPTELTADDHVVIEVPSTPDDRARFVAWLRAVARATPTAQSVAPCSHTPGGMHRLWCIAAARVLLPASIRVQARHDLIGIRLAQLAIGFGADTLAGPTQPDRTLPLAGVTRPTEATPTGLATLVQQVGLRPHTEPRPDETTQTRVDDVA